MNQDLLIHRLHIVVSLIRPGRDPLLFFRLRSLYQAALIKTCPGHGSPACPDQFTCPFHTAFAQELSSDPELMRRHQKPPHPFAWQVPQLDRGRTGDELVLGLTLVGRAAGQIAAHVEALKDLFSADQLPEVTLVAIAVEGVGGELVPWSLTGQSTEPELPTRSWDDLLLHGDPPSSGQVIHLESPLRLLTGGKVLAGFDASQFLRQVVRRCSALASCYGTSVLKTDFRALADASHGVAVVASELRLVNKGGAFQGICGRVELGGDLVDFWPWLQLGQLLNVGKGAAFGLGRFRLG